MNNDKDEPLNINYHKRQLSLRKKRRVNSQRKKKDTTNKTFIKVNIILIIIFIILIGLFGFLIYKKLNVLSDLKLAIIEKNEEVEEEKKIKSDLRDKIKNINKLLDKREKDVKELNKLYEFKKDSFQNKKKIYENIKDIYIKTEHEKLISMTLEEAMNNLNERIKFINE